MKEHEKPVVAAFDFDGTITKWDTFKFFLFYSSSFSRFLINSLVLFPKTLSYFFKRVDRQTLKEAYITRFFGGMAIEDFRLLGQDFAAKKLPKLVKPEAVERIRWHQKQGHRCVLVSASIDIYLVPWTHSMDFEQAITSLVEVNNGRITGRLQGKNCRGPEKVRRLIEAVGPRDSYSLYAYGDSDGDKELLESADFPFYRRMSDG